MSLANLLLLKKKQESSSNSTNEDGRGSKNKVLMLVGNTSYGYNSEEQGGGDHSYYNTLDVTFAPNIAAISSWDALGTSEKERIKAKEQEGRLMYVIFDILMHRGKPMMNLPYSERLEQLKRMPWLTGLKHTKVIAQSWVVHNAEDVIDKLKYIVQVKGEGLILKDPRAKYEFRRTLHQRKLKISGPDINCAVVGLGFTQSKNPRMWGLLTAIHHNNTDEHVFLVYNRVETLEGDRIKIAAEHILNLPSLVPLHQVLHQSSKEKPIEKGGFLIFCSTSGASSSSQHPSVFTVTWQSSTM